MSPSQNHISVKLDKSILAELSPLKFPGESWNHFLSRLMPHIKIAAGKDLRRLAGQRLPRDRKEALDEQA